MLTTVAVIHGLRGRGGVGVGGGREDKRGREEDPWVRSIGLIITFSHLGFRPERKFSIYTQEQ